jgi:ribosome-associated toxin RatA of RatAB toxin-antitoxin module
MKQLSASASAQTSASRERCFALVCGIESYPSWYPDAVTAAEVTERDSDGLPTHASVNLHVAHGVLVRDFKLDVAVETRRLESVEMARVPHRPDDREEFAVGWALTGDGPTQIHVRMRANLSIPGFLPVGGIAESVANGFLNAALNALR